MSTIWFFAVKQGKIVVERLHYRKAKWLLNNKNALEQLVARGHWLDAGYIFLDMDQGELMNGQEAFAVKKFK